MQLERLYFEGLRGDHSWLNSYGSRLAVRASVTEIASYMHTRIAFLPGYHGDNRNECFDKKKVKNKIKSSEGVKSYPPPTTEPALVHS